MSHAMFPDATHDEQAMQNFVKSLRVLSTSNFEKGNRALLGAAIEAGGADPANPSLKDLRKGYAQLPYHQWWSAMLRNTQDLLYATVGPSVERQLDELIERAKTLSGKSGSLRLNPDLPIPRYLSAVDIHRKPGSYHTELDPDDVFAGAEFDRSYRLYSMGSFGPDLDGAGISLANWVAQRFPQLEPTRVLDLGCTVGHATLGYARAYPNAEIHAIDVAAPCLRYGHARAVAMDVPIHFSQQNAESTDFEDASFDLITSSFFLHETSHKAIRKIFKECARLLRPGGVVAHMDPVCPQDHYERYYSEWNAHYNNEPFLGSLQNQDFGAICREAGFANDPILDRAAIVREVGQKLENEYRIFGVLAVQK